MFEVGKIYKNKKGWDVRIYAVDGGPNHDKIHGAQLVPANGWVLSFWGGDGTAFLQSESLVPPRAPAEISDSSELLPSSNKEERLVPVMATLKLRTIRWKQKPYVGDRAQLAQCHEADDYYWDSTTNQQVLVYGPIGDPDDKKAMRIHTNAWLDAVDKDLECSLKKRTK